jgi:hypothetical protein
LIYIQSTLFIEQKMNNLTMNNVAHFHNGYRIPSEFVIPYPEDVMMTPDDFRPRSLNGKDMRLMTPEDFTNQSSKTIKLTTIISFISLILLIFSILFS